MEKIRDGFVFMCVERGIFKKYTDRYILGMAIKLGMDIDGDVMYHYTLRTDTTRKFYVNIANKIVRQIND